MKGGVILIDTELFFGICTIFVQCQSPSAVCCTKGPSCLLSFAESHCAMDELIIYNGFKINKGLNIKGRGMTLYVSSGGKRANDCWENSLSVGGKERCVGDGRGRGRGRPGLASITTEM